MEAGTGVGAANSGRRSGSIASSAPLFTRREEFSIPVEGHLRALFGAHDAGNPANLLFAEGKISLCIAETRAMN